jgi:FAD dependent oxidoreductase TIGR03364
MSQQWDDVVVGAGILGLAFAYHLAKRGRRVAVFERTRRAEGASVRNFGMLWPIGQPAGSLRELALRSRSIWLEVLREAGIWHDRAGSLHLAYHEDEAQILREFLNLCPGQPCELLTPEQARSRCPAINPVSLEAGLWSEMETCVDPRQVVGTLPRWLAERFGVVFHFGTAVSACEPARVLAAGQEHRTGRVWICSGADCATLYPADLQAAGMVSCKLQMLRSQAFGPRFRLGPMLAAGLTLTHYGAFARCPTLPALKTRIARELPLYPRYGIHVMASQNGAGELVLGDSHEYGTDITPFDKSEIDELILEYLRSFLLAPDLQIAARWHGIYAKHPDRAYVTLAPADNVTIVTGVGGAGMTLSFGLAEKIVAETMGEN